MYDNTNASVFNPLITQNAASKVSSVCELVSMLRIGTAGFDREYNFKSNATENIEKQLSSVLERLGKFPRQ